MAALDLFRTSDVAALLARCDLKLAILKGWQRYGVAALLGALTGLTLAPFYILPLLFVGFSGLVWILRHTLEEPKALRKSYFLGWSFGFGYFLIGLFWLGNAFFVQADQFALLSPLAVLGMPAFLGLFTGMAGLLTLVFWRRFGTEGLTGIVLFALAWSLLEFTRGHIFTGLPWNLTAQSFAVLPILSQPLSLFGPYGYGFLMLILAALPAVKSGTLSHRAMAIIGASVIGSITFSILRLSLHPTTFQDNIRVQVVQPNVAQIDKVKGAWADQFFAQLNHTDTTALESMSPDEVAYVIWPENAVPFLSESTDALEIIANKLPRNALLLTGTLRRALSKEETTNYYNSVSVFADITSLKRVNTQSRAEIISYDKAHLVPFGEYLPLADLLKSLGLAQLAPIEEGFSRGPGPRTLPLGETKVSPLICYEIIFPGKSYDKKDRPDWLLTVTNDAWFGNSPGPRQHFDMARMRAVETGLPVVRSANTGISGIISPTGKIITHLKLGTGGNITSGLPRALKPTLYGRFGEGPYFFLVLIMLISTIRKSKKSTENTT